MLLLINADSCFVLGINLVYKTYCSDVHVAGDCLTPLHFILTLILRFLRDGFACFALVLGGEVKS